MRVNANATRKKAIVVLPQQLSLFALALGSVRLEA